MWGNHPPLEPLEPKAPPALPALPAPINVTFRIDAMHAISTTDGGGRDEVYFLVRSSGDSGRSPEEDNYYEAYHQQHLQENGWTDRDGNKRGTPVFWSGALAVGQARTWLVVIGEQDAGIHVTPPDLDDSFDSMMAFVRAKSHQVIGAFKITAENNGGQLQVDGWYGGPMTEYLGPNPERGPNAAYFKARGDGGCEYNFVANIVTS